MGSGGGYVLFFFKKGVFINKGDGGWLNWAYSGEPERMGDCLIYN